jgi:hypothetical protein
MLGWYQNPNKFSYWVGDDKLVSKNSFVETKDFVGQDESYEMMVKEWDRKLNKLLVREVESYKDKAKEFWDRTCSFFIIWASILITVLLIFGIWKLFANNGDHYLKEKASLGYLSLRDTRGEEKILNAPKGVLCVSRSFLYNGKDSLIQFALDLPKLTNDKIYSINYVVSISDEPVFSGMTYTKPKQNGVLFFQQKCDISGYISSADWIKISVKIVDADIIADVKLKSIKA